MKVALHLIYRVKRRFALGSRVLVWGARAPGVPVRWPVSVHRRIPVGSGALPGGPGRPGGAGACGARDRRRESRVRPRRAGRTRPDAPGTGGSRDAGAGWVCSWCAARRGGCGITGEDRVFGVDRVPPGVPDPPRGPFPPGYPPGAGAGGAPGRQGRAGAGRGPVIPGGPDLPRYLTGAPALPARTCAPEAAASRTGRPGPRRRVTPGPWPRSPDGVLSWPDHWGIYQRPLFRAECHIHWFVT